MLKEFRILLLRDPPGAIGIALRSPEPASMNMQSWKRIEDAPNSDQRGSPVEMYRLNLKAMLPKVADKSRARHRRGRRCGLLRCCS
ncbi:hypothetical protein ACM42_05555 [Bradyrhizobium sp. CCBAU 25338]|nr:hypothetical protein [Bradyrhizobium sp. CCBAU 25338]